MTNVRYIGTRKREEIVERQNWLCAICGFPMKRNAFEIDHIQAVENGGDAADDNLRALHPKCHRKKTDEDIRGMRHHDRIAFGKAKRGRKMVSHANPWGYRP